MKARAGLLDVVGSIILMEEYFEEILKLADSEVSAAMSRNTLTALKVWNYLLFGKNSTDLGTSSLDEECSCLGALCGSI